MSDNLHFTVVAPGLSTTIQDLGRYGYRSIGMPVSGAVDGYSMKQANWLVDNPLDSACIECTLSGPTLLFNARCFVAITGADMQPVLNGERIENNRTIVVEKGSTLQLQGCSRGCRSYISIAGGLSVDEQMGSVSTYSRAGVGGLSGQPLVAGDLVSYRSVTDTPLKKLASHYAIGLGNTYRLRVLRGPEFDQLITQSQEDIFQEPYCVSPELDRMGCRLNGTELKHTDSADIISAPVQCGTVQLPANGQPIILLADSQTTGGYTRIADVATVDLPILGQLRSGDQILFDLIEIEDAQSLLRQQMS